MIREPIMKIAAEHEPISLKPDGAVISVLNQILGQDAARIALAAFIEGRELEGSWSLRITGAEIFRAE